MNQQIEGKNKRQKSSEAKEEERVVKQKKKKESCSKEEEEKATLSPPVEFSSLESSRNLESQRSNTQFLILLHPSIAKACFTFETVHQSILFISV